MSDPSRIIVGVESLPVADLELLLFERAWNAHPGGAKEAAAREAFGLTPTAYHRRLAEIVRLPAAEAAEPVLVHRLQGLIARRGAVRSRVRRGSPV